MTRGSNKDGISMVRLNTSIALMLLTLPVAATQAAGPGSRDSNPTLYSTNQPVVQRTDYVIDLDASGNGLSPHERSRLSAWFESLELGYGDRVFVDGDAYASEGARADIASVAGEYGILLSDGAPISAGAVGQSSVRVIVSRTTASVPGCPRWEQGGYGASANTSRNYGCAVNSNLAAMIADPNDLVLGRTGGIDGRDESGTKAIQTYRKKAPTGAGNLKSAGGN